MNCLDKHRSRAIVSGTVQFISGGGVCGIEESEMPLLQEVAKMIQNVTFLFLLSQGPTGTWTLC